MTLRTSLPSIYPNGPVDNSSRTWVAPIPADWRRTRKTSGRDKNGKLYERYTDTLPVFPAFDPAEVRNGDRIGCFTVISDPVFTTVTVVDYERCPSGCLHFHGKRYDPDKTTDVTVAYADMRCNCGYVVPRVEIRGDKYQRTHCGHILSMAPDHFYARNWVKNIGAYKAEA